MPISPCPGLSYQPSCIRMGTRDVALHTTVYDQHANPDLTLLISKASEAVRPNTPGNHVRDGDIMDGFLRQQPGVRFLLNGGFNHYRKIFTVGLIKRSTLGILWAW